MRRALALTALLIVAGCSRAEPPPYRIDMPVKEIMGHVVEPAAEMVWDAAGYEITEAGERELFPSTEDGWLAVENGATIIAESANLLMLPGRAPDDGEWMRLAGDMAEQAMVVKAAAMGKDKTQLFDAGGALYQACVACHDKYVPK
jgi:hypothetical protein